jgi:colicin import membrane protein
VSAAALPSSVLAPQPPGGLGRGAALALAVHVALVAALTVGVDWRTQAPQPVAAELWAAVPEAAAPPPPAPAPSPVPTPAPPPAVAAAAPPDIATERERWRAEQQRREREARAAGAAAEAKAAEERLARQREENLRRMLGQANASPGPATGTGTAAQAAAPSAAYQGRVKAAILPNIVYTGKAPSRAVAEVEVTLAPGGTVIARRLVKRSGHPDWDEAVLRAIDRTPRIPADADGRVPPALLISFRPDE